MQRPEMHWLSAWQISPSSLVAQSGSGRAQPSVHVPSAPHGWQSGSSMQPIGAQVPSAPQLGSLAWIHGRMKSSTNSAMLASPLGLKQLPNE